MSIVEQIQEHLNLYRSTHRQGVPLNKLSPDDISVLKGCHVRSHKSQEQDYRRSWAKLAKAQRLNRLMCYHQKLTKDYELDTKSQHQLKTLFYDGISSDILDKDNVHYNSNEGIIVKVEGLKRDTEGIFYFERSHKQEPVAIVQTIKKFTPLSMSKLSIAQKKSKPLITLKDSQQLGNDIKND